MKKSANKRVLLLHFYVYPTVAGVPEIDAIRQASDGVLSAKSFRTRKYEFFSRCPRLKSRREAGFHTIFTLRIYSKSTWLTRRFNNMPCVDKARVCLSCNRSDRTSFSKCRFCGAVYNEGEGEASSSKKLTVSFFSFIILVGAGYCVFTAVNGMRTKQVTPVGEQVRRASRSYKPASPIDRIMRLRKLANN